MICFVYNTKPKIKEVEINKGRGSVNWVPNLKRVKLNKGELNQENLIDKGQASKKYKLKKSKLKKKVN